MFRRTPWASGRLVCTWVCRISTRYIQFIMENRSARSLKSRWQKERRLLHQRRVRLRSFSEPRVFFLNCERLQQDTIKMHEDAFIGTKKPSGASVYESRKYAQRARELRVACGMTFCAYIATIR
mmetsp:Transcript_1873/g.3334  ORF Transcript_1873/g.3334 Transcript_1873/m.3334 type:complete len:124 (+) Transcript_1873:870-1241(+)